MTLLLTLALACKDGGPAPDDSAPTDDSADSATDSEDSVVPTPPGEDFALYQSDGELLSWFNQAIGFNVQADRKQAVGSAGWFTALADFDGDGLDDLWQIQPDTATLTIFMNTGAEGGHRSPADFEIVTDFSRSFAWILGDWDGDGLDDVGQFNTNTGRMLTWQNAVGTFDANSKIATDLSAAETATLLSGDFDGDGSDDLGLFLDQKVEVYKSVDGAFLTTPLLTVELGPGFLAAMAPDLDEDGVADLAAWSGSTLTWWLSQGGAFDPASPDGSVLLGDQGTPLVGGLN